MPSDPTITQPRAASALTKMGPRNSMGWQSTNSSRWRSIGSSVEGRPISACRLGPRDARRTAVVVGGQHGDEPLAGEAVRCLVQRFEQDTRWHRQDQAIWFIPTLNVDGLALGCRHNAQGHDLNRDHLLRQTPEILQLHHFLEEVQPDRLLDLHTFPCRRKWMKSLNVQHAADVMLDWPSGPACALSKLRKFERPAWLSHCRAALNRTDLLLSRYWLRSASGRVRHSTPDWLDLRNQSAARYGCQSLLIEGQQPWRSPPQAVRTLQTMVRVAEAALALPYPDHTDFTARGSMPLQFHYRKSKPLIAWLRQRDTWCVRRHPVPGRYTPDVLPTQFEDVPETIWIPQRLTGVVDHLRRLGAPLAAITRGAFSHPVNTWRIASASLSSRVHRSARHVRVSAVPSRTTDPSLYWALSDRPRQQRYWFSLLDPRAKYGIARFHPLELPISEGKIFPILFPYHQFRSR